MIEIVSSLLIGYVLGISTILVVIFWNDLIQRLTVFFTFRKLKYKLQNTWWEIKFFIRHRIMRK